MQQFLVLAILNLRYIRNERKSEQAHIPHAPTLLENAVYNEWQFQVLVTYRDINCSLKRSNQHFL